MTPDEFCCPTPVALYRHFDRNGELIYIGITSDPARRWAQHVEQSVWARFVSDTSVHWLESREKARAAERRAIVGDRPLFNRARPADADNLLEHQLAYLRTGVSGLFRRVRCLNEPGVFCLACGPDADAWLDASWQNYLTGASA
jgi:predicted GIY-YIG superfamily endonuclease